jgi:protein TonB
MRVVETVSFGMRAVVASVVVHGTIAAAVATRVLLETPPRTEPVLQLIDIQREPAAIPLVPAPPPPEPAAPATLDSHPHHAATASLPSARVLTTNPQVAQLTAAPVTVIVGPSTAPPSFTIALPNVSGGEGGAGGNGGGPKGATKREADVFDMSGPSALADRIYGPTPVYPREAQEARIEGDVPLLILVDTTGRVVDVRVQRKAGYGLDEAAMNAVRQWTFKPRSLNGLPIAVRVQWTMHFRLD